jgi:hypothetical protein
VHAGTPGLSLAGRWTLADDFRIGRHPTGMCARSVCSPVLKITQRVLIRCENSLLYLILLVLSMEPFGPVLT